MNGSTGGNWSALAELRNCSQGHCAGATGLVHDPGVEMLRHVVEVWLTTPIVLLGIAGNVVAFFVLCQHRRHKLQTTTAILQVEARGAPRDCGSNVSI